jgi:hypothetical protein
MKAAPRRLSSAFPSLTRVEAQARNNAWKVVQDRMQENPGNSEMLLKPP